VHVDRLRAHARLARHRLARLAFEQAMQHFEFASRKMVEPMPNAVIVLLAVESLGRQPHDAVHAVQERL
jgi:hypothetical protein